MLHWIYTGTLGAFVDNYKATKISGNHTKQHKNTAGRLDTKRQAHMFWMNVCF